MSTLCWSVRWKESSTTSPAVSAGPSESDLLRLSELAALSPMLCTSCLRGEPICNFKGNCSGSLAFPKTCHPELFHYHVRGIAVLPACGVSAPSHPVLPRSCSCLLAAMWTTPENGGTAVSHRRLPQVPQFSTVWHTNTYFRSSSRSVFRANTMSLHLFWNRTRISVSSL